MCVCIKSIVLNPDPKPSGDGNFKRLFGISLYANVCLKTPEYALQKYPNIFCLPFVECAKSLSDPKPLSKPQQ